MVIEKRLTAVAENIKYILDVDTDNTFDKPVSVISNFIEDLVEEFNSTKDENQKLKDEVNLLKGEQGKPNIQGNKKNNQGNISSEEERKLAEELDNEDVGDNKTGFKLNKSALEKLKEQRLPVDILDALHSIAGQKFSNESEFISVINTTIGKEAADLHRPLLIKYATYKKRNRKPKLPNIEIDRHVKCEVDRSTLPKDVVFKGYAAKVVQDVVIQTDNVEFKREVYYSASFKKTYSGTIPKGYEGDFGPHINSDILSMKYINGMSIPKIQEFYTSIGTIISESYISMRLTKARYLDVFHAEKSEMYNAGLGVSSYSQIDDTTTRVNGENRYTQIICNDMYTAFFTTKRKDRLTILDVLRNFESRGFLLNDGTFPLLSQLGVSKKHIDFLHNNKNNTIYNEDEILKLLDSCDDLENKPRIKTRILEACAISSYRQETGISVVKILVCDDAPQFKLLTDELSLCWIHEGRHYKRLAPAMEIHREELHSFSRRYWAYYSRLLSFKKNPNDVESEKLSNDFDELFSTKTNYDSLNKRIAQSKSKKNELLVVLNHPEVPLHNNLSENAARVEKRRKDISLQTKTEEGTKAKDTMMSVVETCKKLGVSGYKFIYDRVSKKFIMPTLADIIKKRSKDQHSP